MTHVADVYSDRYAIEGPIARGGMAEVFLARDQYLDRPVAVKVLFPEFARDPSFVERFRREAQSAAMLNHPNIVNVYDYGQEHGTYFIVMEYVEGQSLRDILRTEGTLPPITCARIAAEIAGALDFAHRHGVVHRDIKPGNVLITQSGQVKVTDFGIAANPTDAKQGLTQTGSVIGTASYFSPEQAQGYQVDGRTDVYALGVVLYEMLTGRAPFIGESPVAVAMKHVREQPVPPSQYLPGLPPDLERIVLTAMAKDVETRYQSAEEFRADLIRFGRGHPVQAASIVPVAEAATLVAERPAAAAAAEPEWEQYAPRRRSGPIIATVIGLGLLAAVIGFVIFGAKDDGAAAKTLDVPNVVDLTFDEAKAKLNEAGFDNVDRKDKIDEAPVDTVIAQNPEAGLKAEKNDLIILTVSAKQVAVPNVVGLPFEEAQAKLQALGLLVTRTDVDAPAGTAPGTVLAVTPVAGTKVDKGTAITLNVAKEPLVAIPNVRNMDQGAAQTALQTAGFVVDIALEANDTVPTGKVIDTIPPPGTMAAKGTSVRMRVSTGPNQITVINVVGQNCSSGAAALQGAGFNVTINGSPAGTVTGQNPSSGQFPQGTNVTLDCP
jgi:eukaryotic-like serine/threonine-protein kinase